MQAASVEMCIGQFGIELQGQVVAFECFTEALQVFKSHRALEVQQGLERLLLYGLGKKSNSFIAVAGLT